MKHPFLIGEKIYLRRVEREDLGGNYFQWLNDTEVLRWMFNGAFPNSVEAMEAYYQGVVSGRTDIVFAIILKEDERHVGNIGIHRIEPIARSAEIGILIGERDVWGRGIGTEAIGLLAGHAFLRLNLNRLYAGAHEANAGCLRAFEKNGFRREGVARQAMYVGGAYGNVVNLGLLRSEWNVPARS